MDPQITKLNQILHDEGQRKAELYHKGIKHGEYYRVLKRAQSHFMNFYVALSSLNGKLKKGRHSKSAAFTTETNG